MGNSSSSNNPSPCADESDNINHQRETLEQMIMNCNCKLDKNNRNNEDDVTIQQLFVPPYYRNKPATSIVEFMQYNQAANPRNLRNSEKPEFPFFSNTKCFSV